MSDKVKIIIEIDIEDYKEVKDYGINMFPTVAQAIQNGIPLDSVKAEIKEKCDRIDDIARANIYQYAPHREIQDLLCEILASIGKAESIDPNNLSFMFDGVTAFKGWTSGEMLDQIRTDREEKSNGKNE